LLKSGFAGQYERAVAAGPSAQAIRVGRLYLSGTNPEVDHAVDEALAAAKFKVVTLDRSFVDKWIQAQKDAATIAAAEAWLYDLQFRNEPGVTIRTKAIVTLGQIQYHNAARDAFRRQAAWRAVVRDVLKDVDFIALPTMQALPPRVPLFGSSVAFEARVLALQNTAAVNLAGAPALAIPVPVHDRVVPMTSLQLVGRQRGEAALLNAGRMIEKAVASPEI
jgi:amidase